MGYVAYTPNELYAIKVVNYVSGGHKVYEYVYSDREVAHQVCMTELPENCVGFIIPVHVNFRRA